jgi:hypothetical protein
MHNVPSRHESFDRADRARPGGDHREIRERYPETVVAETMGATFFSLDEKHWPNFATIVTTDEHDEGAPSNLARPGAFRLNIGVDRETFERLVGSMEAPDYAAYDRLVPHPVYAKQRWISILNPSDATFHDDVLPLIAEAHDRLAAVRARHRNEGSPRVMPCSERRRLMSAGVPE